MATRRKTEAKADAANVVEQPGEILKVEEKPKTLDQALALAQAEMPMPAMDKQNPHFGNKYADLASIKKTYQPVLAKHGLYVEHLIHHPDKDDNGKYFLPLTTRVVHAASGDAHQMMSKWPMSGADPQRQGSTLTYAKRYQVCALLDIVADEDDDGNAGADRNGGPPPRQQRRPAQQRGGAARKPMTRREAETGPPSGPPSQEEPPPPVTTDEERASFITGVVDLHEEMNQAESMEALAAIFHRAVTFIRRGVELGHLDKSYMAELRQVKEDNKARVAKLADPHNLGDTEEDIPQ